MKQKNNQVHEFALYIPNLSQLIAHIKNNVLVLVDKNLVQRMINILRFTVEDTCILFDTKQHCKVSIVKIQKKKSVTVHILMQQQNKPLRPEVTFLLPVLKRDALEQSVYALAELGVNRIQLVHTHKIRRKWGEEKEMQRLQKMIVAACELAKQFAIPMLKEPIAFEQAVEQNKNAYKLFADPDGTDAFEVITQIKQESPEQIVLLVGPEADLNQQEKELLQQEKFTFCALTPTVLRAVHAVTVFTGMIRSITK